MKTASTGGALGALASRLLPAWIFAISTAGCACGKNQCDQTSLPQESFVSNLTGRSNIGLWNGRLRLGLKNESDLLIHVNRNIPFERIRCGDIIVFTQPGSSGFICHPVVATGCGWLKTKGNFNAVDDEWPVTRERYAGKVDLVADTDGGTWKTVNNLYARLPVISVPVDRGAKSATAYAAAEKVGNR